MTVSHRDHFPRKTNVNVLCVKEVQNIQLRLPSIPMGIFCQPKDHWLKLCEAVPDIMPALTMFVVVEIIPMNRRKRKKKTLSKGVKLPRPSNMFDSQ